MDHEHEGNQNQSGSGGRLTKTSKSNTTSTGHKGQGTVLQIHASNKGCQRPDAATKSAFRELYHTGKRRKHRSTGIEQLFPSQYLRDCKRPLGKIHSNNRRRLPGSWSSHPPSHFSSTYSSQDHAANLNISQLPYQGVPKDQMKKIHLQSHANEKVMNWLHHNCDLSPSTLESPFYAPASSSGRASVTRPLSSHPWLTESTSSERTFPRTESIRQEPINTDTSGLLGDAMLCFQGPLF